MDRFSPFASACIRVLLLPVGAIAPATFLDFVAQLQEEAAIVGLADITPHLVDGGDDDGDLLLSPKKFAKGSLLYNHTTSASTEQQRQLSPFELFREPLLVLGVVDGRHVHDGDKQKELDAATDQLRDRHPRVVDRQLVILGEAGDSSIQTADNIVFVGTPTQINADTLKEAICKISARFLKELSTYTKALQASPTIQTPGQTARSLQRTTSHRESERRPGSASGRSTPNQSNDTVSPVDDNGARQPPWHRHSPATSFDQIPGASSTSAGVTRSDSRASNTSRNGGRASSQDRVSVQGFGSGSNTSQEKNKQRGKARVGIVIGTIYMMAGQWSEAMRTLTENTNKARILTDHIWHAKGLESIVVCLLLHSWAGLEFQIPSVCYPMTGGPTAAGQRMSVNLPSDFKTTDIAQQASVRSLSTSLPELLGLILSLYRSTEGSLELPYVSVAEATIRCSKLLAILYISNGELGKDNLDRFIGKDKPTVSSHKVRPPSGVATGISKPAIADMLMQAWPWGLDDVPDEDHIAIKAGMAAVFALLGLERKKIITLRSLLLTITAALMREHKRTAAEMGIHPTASLALRDAEEMFTGPDGKSGIEDLIRELGRVYGFESGDATQEPPTPAFRTFFGSDCLKAEVLKDIIAFCQVSLNDQGNEDTRAALFSSFGPGGPVDTETSQSSMSLSKDDQIAFSKPFRSGGQGSRGTSQATPAGVYWDPFIVRGVRLLSPRKDRELLDRTKTSSSGAFSVDSKASSNPLLYDPNTSRPGTAVALEKHILVHLEANECSVLLQNPLEISVEVESLELVTEGVDLEVTLRNKPFTLSPMRLQRVLISVTPLTAGECKIMGCRIKVAGCVEAVFPIFGGLWLPAPSTLVKDIGLAGKQTSSAVDTGQQLLPTARTESVVVVEAQPLLTIECRPPTESSLMVLSGELPVVELKLKNVSTIPARLLRYRFRIDTKGWSKAPRKKIHDGELERTQITDMVAEPGETICTSHSLYGNMLTFEGTKNSSIDIYYCRNDNDSHSRLISQPFDVTVNRVLETTALDIIPHYHHDSEIETDSESLCVLCFDIRSKWPMPVTYKVEFFDLHGDFKRLYSSDTGVLHDGRLHPIRLKIRRLAADAVYGQDSESAMEKLMRRLRISWTIEDREGKNYIWGNPIDHTAVRALVAPAISIRLKIIRAKHPNPADDSRVKVMSYGILMVSLRCDITTNEPLFLVLGALADGNGSLEERVTVISAPVVEIGVLGKGQEVQHNFVISPKKLGETLLQVSVSTHPQIFAGGGSCRRYARLIAVDT